MEKRYTVRQAVTMTGVKSYVLRYWEEELELRICRNEQGHRYYTGNDITLLANIKELKKRGLALRAIKELVPRISRTAPGTTASKVKLLEDEQPEREKILLSGGVGTPIGTLFGVLIKGTISSLITTQGTLSSWWTRIILSALLCFFIVIQSVVASMKKKAK